MAGGREVPPRHHTPRTLDHHCIQTGTATGVAPENAAAAVANVADRAESAPSTVLATPGQAALATDAAALEAGVAAKAALSAARADLAPATARSAALVAADACVVAASKSDQSTAVVLPRSEGCASPWSQRRLPESLPAETHARPSRRWSGKNNDPMEAPGATQTTELLTHGGDASMVTCGTLTLCTVHQKHIALVTVGHIDEETWPDTDTLHRCEEANKGKEQVALEEEMQPLQGTKSTVGPSKPHLHGNGVDNLQHK